MQFAGGIINTVCWGYKKCSLLGLGIMCTVCLEHKCTVCLGHNKCTVCLGHNTRDVRNELLIVL